MFEIFLRSFLREHQFFGHYCILQIRVRWMRPDVYILQKGMCLCISFIEPKFSPQMQKRVKPKCFMQVLNCQSLAPDEKEDTFDTRDRDASGLLFF